jgi:hypothetical protein
MVNKKGMSDVVTNVLIILLVIVAVGILWAFLQPLFTKSGTKLQQAQACLDITLEPVKCVVSGNDANVTVKRNEKVANLVEMRLVFTKGDGSTESKLVNASLPGPLDTSIFSASLNSAPKSVAVAAGIGTEATGEVSYCNLGASTDCR